MRNFDPKSVETAIIEVDGKPVKVVDMDKDSITVQGTDSMPTKISNDRWIPIWLDDDWLTTLNASVGMKIRNVRTTFGISTLKMAC